MELRGASPPVSAVRVGLTSAKYARITSPPELTRGSLMSLSDLASLGSFVSGFAVLVSLVFLYFQLRQLGIQVRQAEKNQVASIGHTRATRMVDFLMRRATSPQFADAVRKGSWGHDDVSLTELAQFRSYIQAAYLNNRDS